METINYAGLSSSALARFGLTVAKAAFESSVAAKLTNGNSLAIAVGYVDMGDSWCQTGQDFFGPDGEQFLPNIDAKTGKLSTTLRYRMNSGAAVKLHGDEIPPHRENAREPRRFTGGVWHPVEVETAEGVFEHIFAGAASGVQGYLDEATVATALDHMAAVWTLRMLARHGEPV